jgi:hypothetical protein
MAGVKISATAVEMDDGRPVLLVEFEPDRGIGPFVVDPLGSSSPPGDDDSREEHS